MVSRSVHAARWVQNFGSQHLCTRLACLEHFVHCGKNPAPFTRNGTWQTNKYTWGYRFSIINQNTLSCSGEILEENEPQALMNQFKVPNLDTVFQLLCEKEAEMKGWKSLPDCNIGGKRNPTIRRKICLTHMKALLLKDFVNARRHIGFLTFQVMYISYKAVD